MSHEGGGVDDPREPGFTAAETIQIGLCEAVSALRGGRAPEAVQALRRIGGLAAGAGPLPHAAVLVRLAQARLAQSEAARAAPEAAARAVQAWSAASRCLDRLAEAGTSGSKLEATARDLRRRAVARLVTLGETAAC